MRAPADIAARLKALGDHDDTMLVEAGAGSGKTSTMAGRVALLIAGGKDPAHIVAISYTVAAASELRARIESFLSLLAKGEAPVDLVAVFSSGVPIDVAARARDGLSKIDGLVATTIHGFCQILLKPYPLEAGMDPGAAIVDPEVAKMAFDDCVEGWLREILNAEVSNFTAELFERDPDTALRTVMATAQAMARYRGMLAPKAAYDPDRLKDLIAAAGTWMKHYPMSAASQPEELGQKSEGVAALGALLIAAPADPVAWALALELPEKLRLKSGGFPAKAANKGAWQDLLGKNEGAIQFERMGLRWAALKDAWFGLKRHCAGVGARRLTEELKQGLDRYRDWKVSSAFIDFEDLLLKSRDLLASNDVIRRRLGARFQHILVDEFQDTDPIQAEILWRLCGDPEDEEDGNWKAFKLRPGSLFLVGDPKQAIFRFRGADIAAYLGAKALIEGSGGSTVPITVNFRSTGEVVRHVNGVYDPVMAGLGQPGFTALDNHREEVGPEVQALDLEISADIALNDRGEAAVDGFRAIEARGVADACRRLIGTFEVHGKGGKKRLVEPGDIALLMPGGTDFWIYEAELEKAGIPIAAQAGKGFLRRQEILDLTALARLLSDPRDTLALGAFLRGPVAGFTDDEILDAIDVQKAADPNRRKKLGLGMNVDDLGNERMKEVLQRLRALRKLGAGTTPFQVLSAAVETFSIKACLVARHPRSAERSLANLDAYLGLSRAWDTRGLKAFADEIRRRMDEDTAAKEGRPDSQGDAVSMVTIHSSKGLEWPVVIPINLVTGIVDRFGPLPSEQGLLLKIFGEAAEGFEEAQEGERLELARERERLLYVADTRARDLLLIPRFKEPPARKCWMSLVPARSSKLPSFDRATLADDMPSRPERGQCADDPASFAKANAEIAAGYRPVERHSPSRHETVPAAALPKIVVADEEPEERSLIVGSSTRGLLLHKLMEEILTGETVEHDIEARAGALLIEIGNPTDVEAAELTSKVRNTLTLPEIAELRPRLMAEIDVAHFDESSRRLTIGVIDAVAMEAGRIEVVVDWKSDVVPTESTIRGYVGQIQDYLAAVACARGLIVFMTSGRIVEVLPRVATLVPGGDKGRQFSLDLS